MTDSLSLDPIDLEILHQLQNNARITNRELAAAAGIAPSTCSDRVTRLRDGGVILDYTARLDPARLGRPLQAFLSVRLHPHSRPIVTEFVAHVRSLEDVRAVYHVTGHDDYLIHVAVAGVEELQRLVLDRFTARGEVSLVHTNLIFEAWSGPELMPPTRR